MSAHCCPAPEPAVDPAYRRALWVALGVNAAMFFVEAAASWASGSLALLADSIDFFGDAANYALSLVVVSMALAVRARAALVKAACMAGFGLFVLGSAAWRAGSGAAPEAFTMGVVGFAALLANVGVAWMLFRFRKGDSQMRSVWICSRNDAIGNLAVMAAALGVFGTGRAWPDLAVAAVMGGLTLSGAQAVWRQARAELRGAATAGGLQGPQHGPGPQTAPAARIATISSGE